METTNHNFDEETFKLYAPNRKLTVEEEKKAYTMVKAGADAKLVSAILSEETGKCVITKQIHNIKHKFLSKEDGNSLNDIQDLKKVNIFLLNLFIFNKLFCILGIG